MRLETVVSGRVSPGTENHPLHQPPSAAFRPFSPPGEEPEDLSSGEITPRADPTRRLIIDSTEGVHSPTLIAEQISLRAQPHHTSSKYCI